MPDKDAQTDAPMIMQNVLTGRWYSVTRAAGSSPSKPAKSTTCDITDQMAAIFKNQIVEGVTRPPDVTLPSMGAWQGQPA